MKPLNTLLTLILLTLVLLIKSPHASKATKQTTDYSNAPSTLNVLYIEPSTASTDVHTLNEKSTLSNSYKKGWILPSSQLLTLTLYLYYDTADESRIRPFIKNGVFNDTADTALQLTAAAPKSSSFFQALYLFFTPEKNCLDYLTRNSWPVEIVERTAPNMFRAKLSGLSLPYSDTPLHICMQQFDIDDNIMDQHRFVYVDFFLCHYQFC
jgi:hypothetical protein